MGFHIRRGIPVGIKYGGSRDAVEARREEVEEEIIGAVKIVQEKNTLDLGERGKDMFVLAVVGV